MMQPELLHPIPVRARPVLPASVTLARAQEGRAFPMPADWIHEGGLRAFRGDAGYLGRSIAALKLYLTLVVNQDATSAAGEPSPILLSYERTTALCGLSDPLICAGKKALLDQGLVTTCGDRQGGTIAYRLTGLRPSKAAASVRRAPQAGARIAALHGLTCRQAPNLAVLKTYIWLSAQGSDRDGVVFLDVDTASGLTKTSHVKIIAALAGLQEIGLTQELGTPSRLAEQRRVRVLPLR
ncbi:hypothetical protein VQ03_07675 [Methylobacterium tarhaniae]|uniref:Uncharacterized protein n=1 Tax=Methylobacterium tarhaniae TaxID=1187852 RepID=A0A0J6TD78_9HYPH|nr:hypothetical protein [Methylobacterium tarhaniae]KMO43563.1 hypothetical protein VQ03_07675 [Methylobacterium tarhaniae]